MPTALTVSARELDDGKPVYSFGYPLSDVGGDVEIDRRWFPEEVRDQMPELPEGKALFVMSHTLKPRATPAIVASPIVAYWMLDIAEQNEIRNHYAVDKPLNFGNSGGPILATETGHVHAMCSGFQAMPMQQPEGRPLVLVPALYGIVTRLTHPTIRGALEAEGVSFVGE